MGTNLSQLLTKYWKKQMIVPKLGDFLRKDLETGRGLMQGYLASPTIFNIVVYAVVREVLDVL